jgi:hypothetical protein
MSTRPISECFFPWKSIYVASDGSLKPCCFATFRAGSLADGSFDEVWNGPIMRQVRRDVRNGFVHTICRGAPCSFARETEEQLGLDAYCLDYELGTFVNFQEGAEGLTYLIDGWSFPEPWGIWSEGKRASMTFKLQPAPKRALLMQVNATGFCGGDHETSVVVETNGQRMARWHFPTGNGMWHKVSLPTSVTRAPYLNVVFHIERPVSPLKLGLSDDYRELGLGMNMLCFQESPRWRPW